MRRLNEDYNNKNMLRKVLFYNFYNFACDNFMSLLAVDASNPASCYDLVVLDFKDST